MGNVKKEYEKLARIKQEGQLDTLPKRLRHMYRKRPRAVAMRKKAFGIWNEYTWEECYQKIKYLALGLVSMGLQKGDKVCIIGDNDPEWFWAELAAQAMGAVPLGIYIDSVPNEIEYIASHSESVFAIAKDQEQSDKFLEIKDKLPRLKQIIYWDPLGMWTYEGNPWLMELKDVLELGELYDKEYPDFYEKRIDEGKLDDLAILSYTSGTTGLPKGVMIGHDALIWGADQLFEHCDVEQGDEYLSFVSPAWIAEQMLGIAVLVTHGIIVNFPEEPETVMQDLREIGAAYFLFGPKQWEDLLSMVQIRISDTTLLRRLVYKACLPIGYKIADFKLDKKEDVTLLWKFLYWVANLICFRPIKDYLGLRKLKIGLTGGSLLGPDTFRWYQALGVNLSETYGASEATPVCLHGRNVNVGTIGHLVDGAEAKISDEGELLVKTPALFQGYYKNPEATAEKMSDGWFHTGDAVTIRDDGELIYLDRVKDLLNLKGGGKYSATYVENRLKFSPYIKDVMIVGDETKEFLLALMVIAFNNVGRWAEKNRIPYTTFIDLSQKQDVYELILPEIVRMNETLPPNAQVEKFINLPKEFDPDEGELTRTRKLKRGFLWNRYQDLIDGAYGGQSTVVREAEVKYQDGRVGKIEATLRIMDVKRNEP
ncbi:MAG: AMP-binding protein [Deltaproteobacteria bacterium]|nr:AMP-binding protein [Deltaproteobacteria bacterium]